MYHYTNDGETGVSLDASKSSCAAKKFHYQEIVFCAL
jgi:hypothetical protein